MMNNNRCAWQDEGDSQCENRAARKYCSSHKGAAAAARQQAYRDRQKSGQQNTETNEAPEYIEAQSGRTIPRPKDVHAKPPRSYEVPEVVDYSNGGMSRPGIYERPHSSTAPASVRQDAVKRAQWEATARNRASRQDNPGDLAYWAALAEMGEEAWLQDQERQQLAQETEPFQHAAYFEAPRRPGYPDPMLADQVDGSSIGFRR